MVIQNSECQSVFVTHAMPSINVGNPYFSKLVIYGYLVHHQDPRILKCYTHPHRYSDGLPYPAWLAMGNAAAAEAATEPAGEAPHTNHGEGLGHLHITPKQKRTCCLLLKIAYVVKCVLTILLSIAVIVVTVTTAIATKIFSSEQSGRLVAMILLIVTAAITLSMVIYAVVAVFRKQWKPMYAASVILLVLATIESVIISVSINVTETDEFNISKTLSQSFNLAREHNPRHVKLWAAIQYDLNCCGVYSPEDYRAIHAPYFPPDVPISCCPRYDPNRSDLVQERERQLCRARQEYYDIGCRNPIISMYKETADTLVTVTVVHIVTMVLVVILGAALTRKLKKPKCNNTTEETPTTSVTELAQSTNVLFKAKTNNKV